MRKTLVLLAIIIAFPSYAQVVKDENHKWIDSYEHLTKHIRPHDADGLRKCESLLREILIGIDEGAYCETDSECTLVGEDPFGSSVPISTEAAEGVQKKMTVFKTSCDNGLIVSVNNSGLINNPKCWKSKCMVETSSR